MLAAIALLIQARDPLSDPALTKPVTFTLRATNAVEGVRGLGGAAAVPMAADETLLHEIIVLRLDGAPLNQSMKRLADACGASWGFEKGKFILRRTPEDETRRRGLDHTRMLAHMKQVVDKATEDLAKEKPFDEATATQAAAVMDRANRAGQNGDYPPKLMEQAGLLRDHLPFPRFAEAVVARLDPAVLALARPNHRTVFSTDPTEMEVPLQADLSAAISTFVSEQRRWVGAAKAQASGAELENLAGPLFFADDPSLKVDVVVERMMTGEGFVEVELVDRHGNIWDEAFRAPGQSATLWLKPEPLEKPVQLNKDELEQLAWLATAGVYWGQRQVKLSAANVDWMRHPDRREPLASFPTSFLMAYAQSRRTNLIADIPDGLIDLGLEPRHGEPITATTYMNSVISLDQDLVKVEDGWTTLRGGALSPESRVTFRADREKLAGLMSQQGMIGFQPDVLAQYAIGSSTMFADALTVAWMRANGINVGVFDWTTLRVEGALAGAKLGIDPGLSTFRLSNCDPAVMAILTEAIFYQRAWIMVDRSGVDASSQRQFQGTEPCDMFPHGIPTGAVLTREARFVDAAFADRLGRYAFSAETIAGGTFRKKYPAPDDPMTTGPTTADQFRLGSTWNLVLKLKLDSDASSGLSAYGTYLSGGEAVPFDQLPPEFVKRESAYYTSLENWRTEMQKNAIRQGGGNCCERASLIRGARVIR